MGSQLQGPALVRGDRKKIGKQRGSREERTTEEEKEREKEERGEREGGGRGRQREMERGGRKRG